MHNFVLFYLGSRSTFQTRSFEQRVLAASRRIPNDEVTKRANVPPRDTRTMQSNRFVANDVTRGPGKGPVSRAMASDDGFWRKLISVNPWNVANKTLTVPAFSCTPTPFLLYTGYIYRRKKNTKRKRFRLQGFIQMCFQDGEYDNWNNDTSTPFYCIPDINAVKMNTRRRGR